MRQSERKIPGKDSCFFIFATFFFVPLGEYDKSIEVGVSHTQDQEPLYEGNLRGSSCASISVDAPSGGVIPVAW